MWALNFFVVKKKSEKLSGIPKVKLVAYLDLVIERRSRNIYTKENAIWNFVEE